MSECVCYIQRTDRGGALKGLRLISGQTDDTWQAGATIDPVLMSESIRQGAQWIRERLGSGKSKSLAVLCLDTDGAVCSWLKPEDANPAMLNASFSSDADLPDDDALDHQPHNGATDRFPKLPLELSFEILAHEETSTGSRAAVMAAPDIPGRLIRDELDSMGVQIGAVTSIWHAVARVWDPGATPAGNSAERIVSSDTPIACAVVLDPNQGRLIWTWSRNGKLITAGSARIEVSRSAHESIALIREDDIARICNDWLSWSSQLGISPSRIVFVGEPGHLQALPDSALGTDADPPAKVGLSPSEVGRALAKAWPDATIDLIAHADPIGETLSRIAGNADTQLVGLSSLMNRPGRAHRAMYRWAGVAFIAISAIIVISSYQLFAQAGQIKEETAQFARERMEVINTYDPELVLSQIPVRNLQSKLDQIRKDNQPIVVQNNKPIMEELETISYVLGIPGIEIETIAINNLTATVVVFVEDIAQAEAIKQSLSAINGSHLRWYKMTPANRSNKIQATFSGRWDTEGADS